MNHGTLIILWIYTMEHLLFRITEWKKYLFSRTCKRLEHGRERQQTGDTDYYVGKTSKNAHINRKYTDSDSFRKTLNVFDS